MKRKKKKAIQSRRMNSGKAVTEKHARGKKTQRPIAAMKEVSEFPPSKFMWLCAHVEHYPELVGFNPRARDAPSSSRPQPRLPVSLPRLAPVRPSASGASLNNTKDKSAAFGERRNSSSTSAIAGSKDKGKDTISNSNRMTFLPGGAEISWVPTKSGAGDDSLFDDGRGMQQKPSKRERADRAGKIEKFGAGMEKGGMPPPSEDDGRAGRTRRRKNVRSGSRNVFRQL